MYGIERAQVVTVGATGTLSGVRHEIEDNGEWQYDADNYTSCGSLAKGVESLSSGGLLSVTCQRCAVSIRRREEQARGSATSE